MSKKDNKKHKSVKIILPIVLITILDLPVEHVRNTALHMRKITIE